MARIRFLHTSDWHLGKSLAGRDRTEDFEAFLSWLRTTIETEKADVLLIAGDVFDTSMPPASAQRLWYQFAVSLAQSRLKACVVCAGNHDSQRFLLAARGLLSPCRVEVSGSDAESEAVVLRDQDGTPWAAVAAVPWLRDGDLYVGAENLNDELRVGRRLEGLRGRYEEVRNLLEKETQGLSIPRIAMGHLFAAGAKAQEEPGKDFSDVFVGKLRSVPPECFGTGWDAVCLGHIHSPQAVTADIPVWYSGSPLQLDFSDRAKRSAVLVWDWEEGRLCAPRMIPVPQTHPLITLKADSLEELCGAMRAAAQKHPRAFLEAVLTRRGPSAQELVQTLQETAEECGVTLVRTGVETDEPEGPGALPETDPEPLSSISREQLYRALLEEKNSPEEMREALLAELLLTTSEVEAGAVPAPEKGPSAPSPESGKQA